MEKIAFALLGVILFNPMSTYAENKLTEVVETDKGLVRGVIEKTVQDNVEYSAFKGIPFAKPPIGFRRFKPPVEVDSWTVPLDTISDPNSCPQVGRTGVVGSEDCLYLNVYTPRINFDSAEDEPLLAVMIWIYGGYFFEGDVNQYGPDFLIEDNVVVIAMNYRLGALGFLSLNHPNATGNAGLKDQELAMKWVARNIRHFGGDPDRITIFGESAGSVSVELHKIADSSQGLFHRSIAMSGSPLNPWAFSSIDDAVKRAWDLGRRLGLVNPTEDELLKRLYEATAGELVLSVADPSTLDNLPFTPTYENEEVAVDGVFLSECPVRIYKSGKFQQLPHILGFTGAETLGFAADAAFFRLVARAALNYALEIPLNLSSSVDIICQIANSRVNSVNDIDKGLMYGMINVSSDLLFIVGIDGEQQYLAEGPEPIYYYRNSFDYNDSDHRLAGVDLKGTAHADDILHIFWSKTNTQSLDPNSAISIQRRKMVRLFTNFAKYADPTPDGIADDLLNVVWSPSGKEGHILEISNDDYKMGPRPADDLVKNIQEAITNDVESFNGCNC